MIDMERLEEIEERVQYATLGPWYMAESTTKIPTEVGEMHVGVGVGIISVAVCGPYGDHASECDADFTAHARQDIPDLCVALREALTERDALRERISILTKTQ